jgi:hypothetical protein
MQRTIRSLGAFVASLVGRQSLSSPWERLRPYLRDKHALDSPQVICSFSCNGSIELRSGYRLDYVYVNPQHLGPWKPDEAIVWSVTLARGKQTLFHREIQPK